MTFSPQDERDWLAQHPVDAVVEVDGRLAALTLRDRLEVHRRANGGEDLLTVLAEVEERHLDAEQETTS